MTSPAEGNQLSRLMTTKKNKLLVRYICVIALIKA